MNCKFKCAGVWRYGRVETYHKDVKKYEARGKALVNDAVVPQVYAIDKKDLLEIPYACPTFRDGILWGGSEDRDFMSLAAIAHDFQEALLPKDKTLKAGHQFQIGVADGYAHYVVLKATARKAEVEWRGFGGDRYADHHFEWGGSFPAKDVARYVRFGRPLFGKPMTAEDHEYRLYRYAYDFLKRFGEDPLPMLRYCLVRDLPRSTMVDRKEGDHEVQAVRA